MGTVSNLLDWLTQKSKLDLAPVSVSAFGFTVGDAFIAWQTISEILGYRTDNNVANRACLEFVAGNQTLSVHERQPGFEALEAAMMATFPNTAAWRQAVLQTTDSHHRTVLYRRA